MNHTHRTIYNHALGAYTAVAETAKAGGKGKRAAVSAPNPYPLARLTLALLIGLGGFGQQAMATVCATGGGTAPGTNSLACGNGAVAAAGGGTAVGKNAQALANNSVALGINSEVQTRSSNSIAIGNNGTVETKANSAVAIGNNATVETKAHNAVAIGINATVETKGGNSIAIGNNATIKANVKTSVAIGAQSEVAGSQSVALGQLATSGGIRPNEDYTPSGVPTQQTIAIGSRSEALGDQSVALGANTRSKGNSSVSIGGDDLDAVASTVKPAYAASMTVAQAKAANDTAAATVYGRISGGDWLVHYENNDASSVYDPNGVQRYTYTESGHGAVAVGVMSTANDLATSFGTRANAYGVGSLALGVGSQAGVKNAATTIINGVTYTEGEGALANGAGAKALGSESVATGAGSIAYNKSDIAIGDGAVAGTNANNGLFDNKAIAIGTGSKATGVQSIAVGTGNEVAAANSGAFGDPNIINGKNIANQAIGGSYAIGNDNFINTSNTFVLGNDNVTNATGTKTSVANSVYLGNKTAVTAGNGVGTKNLTQAGVAGATTTAGDKGTVNSATVGGVTYGGFAGATADGAVSVGAAGNERRVQNVAAGEISATSTDAINGSQLYSVAKNLGAKIDNVAKDAHAGTASAMALAGLPQAFSPGKKMVAVGGATYRGEQAIAASISTVSDNGKWVLKGMVSHSSRGHTGGTVGVGYQW